MIDKNSKFYITATQMLNNYIAGGGNVDDLGVKNEIYKFIKNARVLDKDGKYLDVDTKFRLLGHPRSRSKSKDSKQELINEVNAYKQSGGSFHITRKKLPFYPKLYTYASSLARKGVDLPYEQIMKGLGYKEYSDTYFRCMGIFELKNYRDENGYVDSYRKNAKLKGYITSLTRTLELPTYLVVSLLADENLKKAYIDVEYIEQVKTELQKYVEENGSLKGIKRGNKNLYHRFRTLMNYYGDGSETALTIDDWLNIFDLGEVENRFIGVNNDEMDINPIINNLKQKFGDKEISCKDIDSKDYHLIVKKAVKLGIQVKELFRNYDINYKGNIVNRLSSMKVIEIPYLSEMRKMRDTLLDVQGFTKENGYCEEEIFEARVKACQQVYNKFKDKMFNFTIDEAEDLNDEKLDF